MSEKQLKPGEATRFAENEGKLSGMKKALAPHAAIGRCDVGEDTGAPLSPDYLARDKADIALGRIALPHRYSQKRRAKFCTLGAGR